MTKRTLYITPKNIEVHRLAGGDVAMAFDLDPGTTGFAEGMGLAARMSPDEARRLAASLSRMATAAEGGSSQQ